MVDQNPILAELERFRSRLRFTPETRKVWDTLSDAFREGGPITDNEGIELGWAVGILACATAEGGGGDAFLRQVMPLVDEASKDKIWSELDTVAFRILFAEMLLRSYRQELVPPSNKIALCEKTLSELYAALARHNITMPVDWRQIRQAEA